MTESEELAFNDEEHGEIIREILCLAPCGHYGQICQRWKDHPPVNALNPGHTPTWNVYRSLTARLPDPEFAAQWVARLAKLNGEDLNEVVEDVKSYSILRQNAARHERHREQAAITQKDVEYRETFEALRGQRDELRRAMRDISQLLTDHYAGYTIAADTLRDIREITG